MCQLPHAAKSGRKTKITNGKILALAHYLVPWLESLPGIPGEAGELKQEFEGNKTRFSLVLCVKSDDFGLIIAPREH